MLIPGSNGLKKKKKKKTTKERKVLIIKMLAFSRNKSDIRLQWHDTVKKKKKATTTLNSFLTHEDGSWIETSMLSFKPCLFLTSCAMSQIWQWTEPRWWEPTYNFHTELNWGNVGKFLRLVSSKFQRWCHETKRTLPKRFWVLLWDFE